MAGKYTVYQPGPGSTTAACTVDSEASLFDFIVRAAVSSYGSTQRILLTPTEGDSRGVLLAMSQLLLHEMRQLQLNQQQQHNRQTSGLPQPQQQQQQQQLLAATQTSYPEFSSLCQQVNQRLPRSQLPVELSSYAEVSPVSPDVAFNVTKGASKSEFAGLALYSHKSYTQLQIISIQGHGLLKLMNGFYAEAVAARRGGGIAAAAAAAGDASVCLAVSEAVEVAQEVATLLTSLLEGFMADVDGVSSSSSQASGSQSSQQQQQRQPCRMLMVRDLLGAVTYMAKAQQRAAVNTGSTAATKKAAERQAEACAFDAEGIRQGMWLWLLCFLQHGWHLQLCPTARAVETLLDVAGSRCCWLAEHLQIGGGQLQQQQGGQHQQQQEQQARERQQQQGVQQDSPGRRHRQQVESDAAGAAAAAAADVERCAASPAHKHQQLEKSQLEKSQRPQQQEKQQRQQQQQSKSLTPSGSSFMDWLDDFVEKECGAGKQQQQQQHELPQHHAAAARPTAAAAAAGAEGTAGTGADGVQQGRVAAEVIVLETQPDDVDEVIVLE
jgi:hypothetical protein